jgi:hypothetical protein
MRSLWQPVLVWILVSSAAVGCGYALHWKMGMEQLGAWGSFLAGAGTLVLGFGAIYATFHGTQEYRARTDSDRLKWLSQLQVEFFESKIFLLIRQKIDYDEMDDIFALIQRDRLPDAQFGQSEKELFDKFTDYLNFFEFIAYVRFEKQMLKKDVAALFDYYLRRLGEIHRAAELLSYLKENNFENLHKLLVEYKERAKR